MENAGAPDPTNRVLSSDVSLRFKPSWVPSLVIGGTILLGALIPWLGDIVKGRPLAWTKADLPPALVLLGIWVLLAFWIESARIRIESSTLHYSSAIFYRRSIRLEDIGSAKIESGWSKYSDRSRPFVRLVITPKNGSNTRGFDIGIKPFSRGDVQRLLHAIGQEHEGHALQRRQRNAKGDS